MHLISLWLLLVDRSGIISSFCAMTAKTRKEQGRRAAKSQGKGASFYDFLFLYSRLLHAVFFKNGILEHRRPNLSIQLTTAGAFDVEMGSGHILTQLRDQGPSTLMCIPQEHRNKLPSTLQSFPLHNQCHMV